MKRFEEADKKLAQQTKAQNLDVQKDLFKPALHQGVLQPPS